MTKINIEITSDINISDVKIFKFGYWEDSCIIEEDSFESAYEADINGAEFAPQSRGRILPTALNEGDVFEDVGGQHGWVIASGPETARMIVNEYYAVL